MSSNTKHSKIRNTGILFELLTRQITVDVLNNNKKAQKLIKSYIKQIDDDNDRDDMWKNMFLSRCYTWISDFKNVRK